MRKVIKMRLTMMKELSMEKMRESADPMLTMDGDEWWMPNTPKEKSWINSPILNDSVFYDDLIAAADVDEITNLFDTMEHYGEEKATPTRTASIGTESGFEGQTSIQTKNFEFDERSPTVDKDKVTSLLFDPPDEDASVVEDGSHKPDDKLSAEQCGLMKDFGLTKEQMSRILKTAKTSPADGVCSNQDINAKVANMVPKQSFVPSWAATVDPRSMQPTAFSRGLIDLRIPCVPIPRIDGVANDDPVVVLPVPRELGTSTTAQRVGTMDHDASVCDICLSDKTPKRKAILHKWRETRKRRQWGRSQRYKRRSNVASSRERVNGRFVSTCPKWL